MQSEFSAAFEQYLRDSGVPRPREGVELREAEAQVSHPVSLLVHVCRVGCIAVVVDGTSVRGGRGNLGSGQHVRTYVHDEVPRSMRMSIHN
jgi:hypothetical protein